MAITKKQDWMNDYLAKNDFIVSSHSSMNKKLNLDDEWDVSIRFTGNANMGYTYLMVIIIEDNPIDILEQIKNNLHILNFVNVLNEKMSTNINLLLCGKSNGTFAYQISSDCINFSKFDENSLASYFEKIDKRYIENIGTNKIINKSMNDEFQAWTRARLSKYITVNDFDALYIKDDIFYIFELKRINPDINKLEDWRPYCNDYGNYRACNIIRQSFSLTNDMFRTIAYTLEDENKISIFTFNTVNKNDFRGSFNVLAPDEIFQPLSQNFQGCK